MIEFDQNRRLRRARPRASMAALVVACASMFAVQEISARPSVEKEACMAGVREQARAAREACLKEPFGSARNRCRDRADRQEAAGRDACRKMKPPASPYQR